MTELRDCLVMAPLAGLSTPALRSLAEDFGGCDLYYSEMISAAAYVSNSPYEKYYTDPSPAPRKIVYQLVGAHGTQLASAAERLDDLPGFGIDLNMGCSAPEIVRTGAGVALMRDQENACRIVAALRRVVKNKRLSVKLRLGDSEDGDRLVRFCQALAGAGCDYLSLHPRTRGDKFKRSARIEYIGLLKQELNIPIIGNGDVVSYETYSRMKRDASPDGVMIGRACARAPWIFAYLRSRGQTPETDFQVDLAGVGLRFIENLRRSQPPEFLLSRSRRFFSYFSANLRYGHEFFRLLGRLSGIDGIEEFVRSYFREHPHAALHIERG